MSGASADAALDPPLVAHLGPGRRVDVGGIGSWVHDRGDGPVVLLLHGGAWGEAAQTTWFATAPALIEAGYWVIAPDWIGFGRSDKLRDFVDLPGRMLSVVAGLLDALDAAELHCAVGLSMGGSHLLRSLADGGPLTPRCAALVSAGGPPIAGAARERLMAYDGSIEQMRTQVRQACAAGGWADDEEYVAMRHAFSLLPGSFEWFSSLGLTNPAARPRPQGDPVRYEAVTVPCLVVVGESDPFKPSGWEDDMVARLPQVRVHRLSDVGHLPPLEDPAAFNDVLLSFLADQPAREG
jgi:pimeloyl-ACP methyl ester carboxylesterase